MLPWPLKPGHDLQRAVWTSVTVVPARTRATRQESKCETYTSVYDDCVSVFKPYSSTFCLRSHALSRKNSLIKVSRPRWATLLHAAGPSCYCSVSVRIKAARCFSKQKGECFFSGSSSGMDVLSHGPWPLPPLSHTWTFLEFLGCKAL